MKELAVCDYESPSGHIGYRACAPAIPGCVVISQSGEHAARLVWQAIVAMHDEPNANTDVSDEIAMLSHRAA